MAFDPYVPPGGQRLLQFLDGLPVETRWADGTHVMWRTGQTNRAPGVAGHEAASHCSAFVAAAALLLDIYILRPDDHPQRFLANAQVDWLNGVVDGGIGTAAGAGWRKLGVNDDETLDQAVDLAGQGALVVAGYRADAGSGHIAIVRALEDLDPPLDGEGPVMTSVGQSNFYRIRMSRAFEHHPGAWSDRKIELFVNETTGLDRDEGE